jgi:hypothetical protein
VDQETGLPPTTIMPYVQQQYRFDPRSRQAGLHMRSLSSSLGPTSLTYKGVIGIAIVAAIVLFIVACLLLARHAQNKDRLERARILEEIQGAEIQMDFKTAVLSISAPDISIARRLSADTYEPRGGRIVYSEWEGVDPFQGPRPAPKTKPIGHHKHTRTSRIRDSWPLSNIPSSIFPGQMTMTLNQVAPPGYLVEPESKWPRRSGSSRHSRTKIIIPSPGTFSQSLTTDPDTPTPRSRKPYLRRRSTSETQLSTILRSTSQRLKAAQRHSLTRTLTTFTRLPGSPPKHRLPTPPGAKKPNESSEGLVGTTLFESPNSSVLDAFMRTPSPEKPEHNALENLSVNGIRSSASSVVSDDSLCEIHPPEQVVPGLLTSPNRRNNLPTQRHRMTIPTSTLLPPRLADTRSFTSSLSPSKHLSVEESEIINTSQQHIPSSGDPFYSCVKSSKPAFPKTFHQGPQPLYIRKATFGQETTTERPASYISPLQDVSGNIQYPKRKSLSQLSTSTITSESNPFQWSPQEAMQEKPRHRSPQRSGGKPKGHKRSNVIRMSNFIRRQSDISVRPVLEESEEETPEMEFDVPPTAPLHLVDSSKSRSLTPAVASRGLAIRPPSVAIFNPTLVIQELKPHLVSKTSVQHTTCAQSPTLSNNNYYTEHAGNSEEEFFNSKRPAIPPKDHKRNSSVIPAKRTELSVERKSHDSHRLASPALPEQVKLKPCPSPILSPEANVSQLSSNMIVSSARLQSSPTSLAPSLLMTPIPGHLTGPRSQPSRISSSPPREPLHMTIYKLRRMNSEISHYSGCFDIDNRSPTRSPEPPLTRPLPSIIRRSTSTRATNNEDRIGGSRGSQNYLSMGVSTGDIRKNRASANYTGSVRNSCVLSIKDRRDSNHLYKERRRRRMEEEFSDVDLKTVGEFSCHEDKVPDNIKFSFLKLSGTRSLLQISIQSSEAPEVSFQNSERWSEVMAKPVQSVVRRESQMECPSPKSPRAFDCEINELGLEAGKDQTMYTDNRKVRFKRAPSFCPDSPGMYDDDGFLKSSPFKPRGKA